MLENKADKEIIDKLLDRMNKMEEITTKIGGQLAGGDEDEDDIVEEEEGEERDDIEGSPEANKEL